MPLSTPYLFSGVIYDTDEAVEGDVTVRIENLATGEHTSTTTNSSGEYELNAASLTSGYSNGDTFYLFCQKGNKSEWYKTAIDTSEGSEEKDLYLKNFALKWKQKTSAASSPMRLYSYHCTNVDENNTRYISFEDIDGEEIIRVNVSPGETIGRGFSPGIFFNGAVRVLEDGTGGLKPVHSGQSKVGRIIISGVIQ